jgi:hypothetical protein
MATTVRLIYRKRDGEKLERFGPCPRKQDRPQQGRLAADHRTPNRRRQVHGPVRLDGE